MSDRLQRWIIKNFPSFCEYVSKRIDKMGGQKVDVGVLRIKKGEGRRLSFRMSSDVGPNADQNECQTGSCKS